MLVSGDDQGKIWVYDITKTPKAKPTGNKPPTQKATYVSIVHRKVFCFVCLFVCLFVMGWYQGQKFVAVCENQI